MVVSLLEMGEISRNNLRGRSKFKLGTEKEEKKQVWTTVVPVRMEDTTGCRMSRMFKCRVGKEVKERLSPQETK